jgi:rhodanese-related sulfurtransferase
MHQKFGHWMVWTGLVAALAMTSGCFRTTTTDKNLTFISVVEAQEVVAGKKQLLGLAGTAKGVWLDPRTPQEFAAEHIPGAINVPYENLADEFKTLKQYDILVVYGVDYNDPKADAYSKRLIELGHRDVRTLNGGLRAWKADGNPVEGTNVKS